MNTALVKQLNRLEGLAEVIKEECHKTRELLSVAERSAARKGLRRETARMKQEMEDAKDKADMLKRLSNPNMIRRNKVLK